MLVAAAETGRDSHGRAAPDHERVRHVARRALPGRPHRPVRVREPHPRAPEAVLGLRKQIDAVVRDVVTAGVAAAEFAVEDIPETTLALLSMAVDVARWYDPEIKRTPESIGRAYARPRSAPGGGGASPARGMVPVVTLLTYALRHR